MFWLISCIHRARVNYRDNRDIKQHYRDMRISVIAQL